MFENAPCQFEPPAGEVVDCGYLVVPEDRGRIGGPTLRLHVAVFRSHSRDPRPDPVVFLAGGPGGYSLEPTDFTFEGFLPILEDRDLIMFDQRGTGYSEPNLSCSESTELVYALLNVDIDREASSARAVDAAMACHDRLVAAGVDLTAYNSAENATDVADLRTALRIDEWNLYGVSYGTRVAQTVMRDHPQGVRSVVLDSAYPLETDFFAGVLPNLDRSLRALFDACSADHVCDDAYPDLESALWQAVDRLAQDPVSTTLTKLDSGERFDALVGGGAWLSSVITAFYSTEFIPLLPEIVYDGANGVVDTVAFLGGGELALLGLLAEGVYYSVDCAEEMAFTSAAMIRDSAAPYSRFQSSYDPTRTVLAVCESWTTKAVGPEENQAVVSDIPTFVLSGQFDPVTPPSGGRSVAESLENSYFFEFPGFGHAVTSIEGCPMSIMLAFLAVPASEPDSTCIAGSDPLVFLVPEQTIPMVSFTDKELGISGVVPEGWSELFPGFYSRSAAGLTTINQETIPGAGGDVVLSLLASNLGLEDAPEPAATRKTDTLSWELYAVEALGQNIDIALAEDNARTAYMVLYFSVGSRRSVN